MLKPCFTLAAVTLALSASVQAALLTITNSSFETPVATDGSFSVYRTTPITGYGANYPQPTGFADAGVENPSAAEYTGAGGAGTPSGALGSQVLFLNQSNTGLTSDLFQDVGALQANTRYTLTVAIGQRLDRVNQAGQLSLINTAAGSGTTGTPLTSGTILSSTTGLSSVAGMFQDFTTIFTTGSTVSGDLTIDLAIFANGGIQASFDNVRLDATPVPEPTTTTLSVVGGLGLFGWLRRRQGRSPSPRSLYQPRAAV